MEWLPFELHPGIPPEGKPLPDYIRTAGDSYNARLKSMADEAGLPMVFHNRMINTRRALEASEYAREKGLHVQFHEVVFRKLYGEGQDIYDWGVLFEAADEVGLDPVEMRQRVETGMYGLVVSASIQEAVMKGIRGVPAYIFEEKYLISGAQPYEIFRRVMNELGAKPKNNGS